MTTKPSNEAKARIPVKEDTLERLRRFSDGLGTRYDDAINYLLDSILKGGDPYPSGRSLGPKQLPTETVSMLFDSNDGSITFYPGKIDHHTEMTSTVLRITRNPTLEWFKLVVYHGSELTDDQIAAEYAKRHRTELVQLLAQETR